MTKQEVRTMILKWYDAEDTSQTDDEFLVDWVDTLIEETLSDGSDWNEEIEFIVQNCNHKIKGVRVFRGKRKTTYMATFDVPKNNGKTLQVSCGSYPTIMEAIRARKDAEEKREQQKLRRKNENLHFTKWPNRRTIERLRQEYPVGCRVKLLKMDDKQAPPIGTLGTVRGVDDTGSILVNWDSGGSLNVLFHVDECEKVE